MESTEWQTIAKDLTIDNHTVTDLKTEQSYCIRVQAHNKYGNSEPTEEAIVESRAGEWRGDAIKMMMQSS